MVFGFRKKSAAERSSKNLSQGKEPLAESHYSPTKWDKLISKAVKWLATEHYFFKEFKQDLEELKSDLEEAKSKRSLADIKKAFKDFRYIGKANRRLARIEEHIEKALEVVEKEAVLTDHSEDVEKLRAILRVEVRFVLKDAVYYGDRIRFYLKIVRKEIETGDKIHYLKELEGVVDACDHWLAALSHSFQNASDIFLRFYRSPLGFLSYTNAEYYSTYESNRREVADSLLLYGLHDLEKSKNQKEEREATTRLFTQLGSGDQQIAKDQERYKKNFAARKKELAAKLETGKNCQRVLQQEIAWVKKEIEHCSLIIKHVEQAMDKSKIRWCFITPTLKLVLGSTLAKKQEAQKYLDYLLLCETLMVKAIGGVSVTKEGGELSVAEEEGKLSLEK